MDRQRGGAMTPGVCKEWQGKCPEGSLRRGRLEGWASGQDEIMSNVKVPLIWERWW